MTKRLSWLHCWYAPDAVPEEYTQPKAGGRRVHPCHFKPEDLELRDREGGSGAGASPRARPFQGCGDGDLG